MMEETVDLGENSQCPSRGLPVAIDCELLPPYMDAQDDRFVSGPAASRDDTARVGTHPVRSSGTPPESHGGPPHKVRGPNWTEAEMLVLIAHKCIEWDGRHNCNQPSLAKFVYGSTAWKLVLAGCMSVQGFRARDTNQITNKWDGLIKDYKRLKEYIDGTGSGNW